MGCDIHLFVERCISGVWHFTPAPDTWDSWDMKHVPRRHVDDCDTYRFSGAWFNQRNYELFGWLAGVRGDTEPLKPPRGVPGNASLEVRRERRRWGVDGHSASRYTLAELRESIETVVVRHSGRMPPETYEAWKASKGHFPELWYGSCSSARETLSELDYVKRRMAGTLPTHRFDIACAWTTPARESFGSFFALLDALDALGSDRENTRIVFWFDN